jgi:uncharacterized membrane protein
MEYRQNARPQAERLAKSLGWFSVGLGVAELTAPARVARLVGIRQPNGAASIVRAMGARELVSGMAILANPKRSAGAWSRVAGDGLDLWLLQQTSRRGDVDRGRWLAATAAVLGVTIADLLCAQELRAHENRTVTSQRRSHLERAITINKPLDEVYRFWRDFANLPKVTRSVEAVRELGDRRSHWKVRTPTGVAIAWEAEITDERPNERLGWRSISGPVNHLGAIAFRRAPGNRGTEVRVTVNYEPPAGPIGSGMAWLFDGTLERRIQEDLRRCKQFLETGEIPISEGPGLWRPAQPPRNPDKLRKYAGVDR